MNLYDLDEIQLSQFLLTAGHKNFKLILQSNKQEEILAFLRFMFKTHPLVFLEHNISYPYGNLSTYRKIEQALIHHLVANPLLLDLVKEDLASWLAEISHRINEAQALIVLHAFNDHPSLLGRFMGLINGRIKNDELCRFPVERDNFLSFDGYTKFPKSEYWRLFMDGNQHNQGWSIYDAHEPGCMLALYLAWDKMMQEPSHALSPAYFLACHNILSQNTIANSSERGAFRTENDKLIFGLSADSLSINGFFEYFDCYKDKGIIDVDKTYESSLQFSFHPKIASTNDIEEEITRILCQYEQSIMDSHDDRDKLLFAIIDLCKSLILLHPFVDCNGRLFCNLLLNQQLIRHHFSPTILENPNRFDGFSSIELIDEIIRGQKYFYEIVQNSNQYQAQTEAFFKKTGYYPLGNHQWMHQLSKMALLVGMATLFPMILSLVFNLQILAASFLAVSVVLLSMSLYYSRSLRVEYTSSSWLGT